MIVPELTPLIPAVPVAAAAKLADNVADDSREDAKALAVTEAVGGTSISAVTFTEPALKVMVTMEAEMPAPASSANACAKDVSNAAFTVAEAIRSAKFTFARVVSAVTRFVPAAVGACVGVCVGVAVGANDAPGGNGVGTGVGGVASLA